MPCPKWIDCDPKPTIPVNATGEIYVPSTGTALTFDGKELTVGRKKLTIDRKELTGKKGLTGDGNYIRPLLPESQMRRCPACFLFKNSAKIMDRLEAKFISNLFYGKVRVN